MLTYDQAVHFLEGILRMPPEWRDLLHNKPLEFLKLYMKRHAVRVPFQNIQMAAVNKDKRWFPYENDVIAVGLAGKGGCCVHLNYFTKLVFQAIGLDSFVVRGDHYGVKTPGTHCLVMVKLYHPQEHTGTYLVEVGGAYPILEPIPMDKEKLPYKTLQAGGFAYEYREFAPGWIGRYHLKGGLLNGAYTDREEALRTSWDLKPRGLWEFDYPMLETFTNPENSGLLKNPMMYRFFTNAEFRRLFPDLPENAKQKILVTATRPLSQLNKAKTQDKFMKVSVTTSAVKPKLTATAPSPTTTDKKPPTESPLKEVTNNAKSPTKNSLNGKSTVTANKKNNEKSTVAPTVTPGSNGKQSGKGATKPNSNDAKATTGKSLANIIINTSAKTPTTVEVESEEEEQYEVVTEEEVSSSEDDDDLDDPKNFIFVWKKRIVVGDANSRKVVKDYDSYEKLGEDLKKYFPRLPTSTIEKAMKAFAEFELTPSHYDIVL